MPQFYAWIGGRSGWWLVVYHHYIYVYILICMQSLNIEIAWKHFTRKIALDLLINLLLFCTQSENYFSQKLSCSYLPLTHWTCLSHPFHEFISVIKTTKLNFTIFATLMLLVCFSWKVNHSNKHINSPTQLSPHQKCYEYCQCGENTVSHGNWLQRRQCTFG